MNTVSSLSEEFIGRSRKDIVESLELIAPVEKSAYLKALERAPRLVETESDPLRFLERESFNCWDAAKRLVSYWEAREKAFGEKAFLPLALTGETALSDECLLAIREGVMRMLPQDTEGRSVLCYEHNRYRKLSIANRIQMAFYFCNISMRNPLSQKQGVCILALMDEISFYRSGKMLIHVIRTALTTRLYSFHIISRDATAVGEGIAPIVIKLLGLLTDRKTYIHTCYTAEERTKKLSAFGIDVQSLVSDEQEARVTGSNLNNMYSSARGGNGSGYHVQGQKSLASTFFASQGVVLPTFQAVGPVSVPYNNAQPLLKPKKECSMNISTKERENKIFKPIGRKRRRREPKAPEKNEIPIGVNEFDVLLGRGLSHVNHPGNQHLQSLVELHFGSFEAASKKEMKRIKYKILDEILKKGRFMKYEVKSKEWVEISYGFEKIGESFQNHRKKLQHAASDLAA